MGLNTHAFGFLDGLQQSEKVKLIIMSVGLLLG